MFHYPFTNDKDAITVTWHDLDHLEEGEFLNDVVIEFYLKYLTHSLEDKKKAEECYVFSSYFYSQLTVKTGGLSIFFVFCLIVTECYLTHSLSSYFLSWNNHVDFNEWNRIRNRKCDIDETYEKVKKWTSNVNIFDKKYLFVPINEK